MKKLLFLIAIVGLFSCNSGNEKRTGSTEQTAEIVEATINIGGLHCANCVASVEKGINDLEGIKNVVVTLDDSTAVIEYDTSKLELAEIEQAVEKRGYTVKN
ncbi:heavy-metal-associated domain-containing protein [Prolixibacteraceae bacterium Z1-6]|uniref:Heavy-metal-associated domain-containing protein n=1 Tax=Draconibacterium aestuarii TaxID=2998507 RepID=A0A9X3J6I3_9BACT|nr:heavy-metal-associated domain-containing protein [Prolixibacteraceae bacterium Z1-6]